MNIEVGEIIIFQKWDSTKARYSSWPTVLSLDFYPRNSGIEVNSHDLSVSLLDHNESLLIIKNRAYLVVLSLINPDAIYSGFAYVRQLLDNNQFDGNAEIFLSADTSHDWLEKYKYNLAIILSESCLKGLVTLDKLPESVTVSF